MITDSQQSGNRRPVYLNVIECQCHGGVTTIVHCQCMPLHQLSPHIPHPLPLCPPEDLPEPVRQQYRDNLRWIREAGQHGLVVGSQARILYSDCRGRSAIALAFNQAVRDGSLQVRDSCARGGDRTVWSR